MEVPTMNDALTQSLEAAVEAYKNYTHDPTRRNSRRAQMRKQAAFDAAMGELRKFDLEERAEYTVSIIDKLLTRVTNDDASIDQLEELVA